MRARLRQTRASACAPSHLTGFFQIFDNGSTGAGLNTADGAITEVEIGEEAWVEPSIAINGDDSEAPVSRRVIEKFRPQFSAAGVAMGSLKIRHRIRYPIGYGLGMSGAGAFSLALALNELLEHGLSYSECMELAVLAEIESGTGLGDVVAQQFTGVMIGMPPYPSRSVELLPHQNEKVVCAFFEPLDTGKIIRDADCKKRINQAGARAMAALLAERTLTHFMGLCRAFTFETGLASPQLQEVLQAVPESSMAMLGQTAFALTNDYRRIEAEFRRFTNRVVVSELASFPARVL